MNISVNNKRPIIIIPAYCPDERLIKMIDELREKVDFPIIVIDDGSGIEYKDIFIEAKRRSNCLVYHNSVNKGKGIALKNGVRYAMENFPEGCGYITCDADGQHSSEDIIRIADILINNKECIVLGARDFTLKDVPMKSRIGNNISSFIFYLITGERCRDTQTGLRGISRIYENDFLDEKGERYEFEMNFLISMAKKGVKLREITIKTIYIDENKSSHYRAVKDSFRIFRGIFKYTGSSLISAIVDIIIFTILSNTVFKLFSLGILISTIIARLCSGVINFLINQRWVFNGEKNTSELIKYSGLFFTQMMLSGSLVSLFTFNRSNATIVKIIVDSILFFISFFIQKNLIFITVNRKEGN